MRPTVRSPPIVTVSAIRISGVISHLLDTRGDECHRACERHLVKSPPAPPAWPCPGDKGRLGEDYPHAYRGQPTAQGANRAHARLRARRTREHQLKSWLIPRTLRCYPGILRRTAVARCHADRKASRSALMVSACVVSIAAWQSCAGRQSWQERFLEHQLLHPGPVEGGDGVGDGRAPVLAGDAELAEAQVGGQSGDVTGHRGGVVAGQGRWEPPKLRLSTAMTV